MLHVSFSIEGLLAAAVSAQGWAIPWRFRFAFFLLWLLFISMVVSLHFAAGANAGFLTVHPCS